MSARTTSNSKSPDASKKSLANSRPQTSAGCTLPHVSTPSVSLAVCWRKDGLRIVLDTPDEFTANSVNRGWLEAWAANKWNRREGDRVRNSDLWREFRRLMQNHEVEVRLTLDSANSDVMLKRAEELARREVERVQEDSAFKELEEKAVKDGTLIRIFTDGSALENPGPGGWAAIMEVKGKRASQSQGFQHTTNNRMELMGAAETLDILVKLKITRQDRRCRKDHRHHRLRIPRECNDARMGEKSGAKTSGSNKTATKPKTPTSGNASYTPQTA